MRTAAEPRAEWAEWAAWTCKERQRSLLFDAQRRKVDRKPPAGNCRGFFCSQDRAVNAPISAWPSRRVQRDFLRRRDDQRVFLPLPQAGEATGKGFAVESQRHDGSRHRASATAPGVTHARHIPHRSAAIDRCPLPDRASGASKFWNCSVLAAWARSIARVIPASDAKSR